MECDLYAMNERNLTPTLFDYGNSRQFEVDYSFITVRLIKDHIINSDLYE